MRTNVRLSPDQIKYLKIFMGYKSFARQEYLNREIGPEQKRIEMELINLNVLKRDKRGSLRGPSYNECQEMIRLNTETVESLQSQIEKYLVSIQDLKADIEHRSKTDASFCFYSRDLYEQMRYYNETVATLRETIRKFQTETLRTS